MDVRMPDGTIITGVPDNITQTDLLARYNKFSTAAPAQTAPPEPVTADVMGNLTGIAGLSQQAPKPQAEAEMKPYEPSFFEELQNVGRRGMLQSKQAQNTLGFQAGLIDPATYAEQTRELNRKMGAAAPSGSVAEGLDRLQQANETGSYKEVLGEMFKSKNIPALAALVAESGIATAEALPFSIAGGLTGGPLGAAAATGATSFAMEYGNAIGEMLQKKKVDPSDTLAVRNLLEDPKFLNEARDYGIKRGIPVAAFDALSAGFAGRFVRTLERGIANKTISKETIGKEMGKAAAKEAGIQVGAGMAGEATGQAFTGENKPLDVLIEGLAEIPGGVSEVATNVYRGRQEQAQPEIQTISPEERLARSKGFLTPERQPGIADLLKQMQEEQKAAAQPPSASPVVSTTTVNDGGKESVKTTHRDGSVDIDGVQVTPPVAEVPAAPVEAAPSTELLKEATPQPEQSQDLDAMLAELEAQLEGKPVKVEPVAEAPAPVAPVAEPVATEPVAPAEEPAAPATAPVAEPSITELQSKEPVAAPAPSTKLVEQVASPAEAERKTFDSAGWDKTENTINAKTGEPRFPEGVERFTKQDENGNDLRVLTRDGEVRQSTTISPPITLTNSSFGDENESITGRIEVNNLTGKLVFINDSTGYVAKMSPRAEQQHKEGVPFNKIAEQEFSDSGGIRPDGTRTPHTTTSVMATPAATPKTNINPVKVAAPSTELVEQVAAPSAAPTKQAPKAQASKTKVSEEEKLVDLIKEAAYKSNSLQPAPTTVDEFIAKHGKKTFERAVELGLLDNKIGDGRLFPSNKFAYEVLGNYYDSKGKKLKQPTVATAKAPAQPVAEEATQEAPETDEIAKAKQDLEDALGDLAWLATKTTRLNMLPEEEQKLIPVLTRLMDAAFRLGHLKFKEAARFVMDTIRSRLGDDAADKITLDHLQGAYIGMAGKYQDQGASSKKDVVTVESLDELTEEAPEETLFSLSNPDQKFEVAQAVAEHFDEGNKFPSIVAARAFIAEKFGIEIRPGSESAKQADETIEAGVVLAARNIIESGRKDGLTVDQIYENLVDLYDRQPNLNVRSSTSVANQAYSTPAPLAYVASELAGITNKTSVYEPTGGNGMLLIGANPKLVTVNELNEDRFNTLKQLYPEATLTQGNALDVDTKGKSFDVVIENPPFGKVGDISNIDHDIAEHSLEMLDENGRSVLILGGVQASTEEGRREGYRDKAKREFYYNLYNNYNVVDHFTVGGNMYAKQGTTYPVDFIVIEGKGKSSRDLPAADLPQLITSYEQLKEKLNDRMVSGEDRGAGRANSGETAAGEGKPSPVGGRTERQGVESGTEGRGPAGVGERGVQANEPAAGGQREPAGGRAGEEQPGAANVSERGGKGEPVAGTSEPKRGSEAGVKGNRPSELGGVSVVSGERVGSGLKNRAGEEQETANQVSYVPHSQANSVGTLVPKAMADAIEASLAKVEAQVGNVDEYVAESLDMDPETVRELFSAEQVDALTLAITNAEAGKGFIIGDQTGVGKGRVVAAMIRYALVHGKVPIFVTEKPNLYSDMIRDLDDIGMTNELGLDTAKPKILITNSSEAIPYTLLRSKDGEITENNLTLKAPSTGAKLDSLLRDLQKNDSLGQYKVIFTTYSQLQNVKGKGTERQNFIKHFGAGNYMIFDESHNAGGAGAEPAKEGESQVMGRAGFVRSLVQNAFGTFFSSATYAKRPDVMDLYSSTDMSLAVDKMSELSEAIQAGGIPMQQTVANMLTQVGQYIRRERTFAGVSYNTQETKVDKETAENMATSMRDILAFSRAKEVVVKGLQKELDKQGARAGMEGEKSQIQSANFGSIMHNLIDQMLLSLKAQDSVRHAIERLKAGEKVVMTVSNTMGSFLQSYADEMKLVTGDAVNLSFSDLYKRYLEKQRIIVVKKPGGRKEEYRLTDEDLGPALVAQYKKISDFIDNAGFGSAPISPIDYLHAELRKAGYKTEEITGRTVTLNYESGKPLLTSRSANIKQRVNAVKAFNSGAADVIILNQAGSTGLSLHASNKVKDQRKRHMIIVQPEKNIDTHMQMLGRVHRTGQVIPPSYSQMMADIPAEMRPAAVLLKKMASLNANTTASRKSAVSAEGAVDFMNDYGGQVAQEYLRDNPDVYEALGGNKIVQIKEDPTEADEADIRRLTGYIPILPIKQQEEIYKDIVDRYNDLIEREDSMGTNKLESKPMDLDAETLSSKPITEDKGEQSVFAQPAMMERVDVKRTVKPYSKEEVQDMVKENRAKQDSNDKLLWATIETKARAFGDKQIGDMLSKEADPVRVTAFQNQLQTQLSHVKTVLLNYPIGSQISVKNNNGVFVYGVVTDLEHKGKTKNPVAGSDWKMTIALANGDAKSINLTFSQIGSTYQLKAESEVQYLNPETLKGEYIPLIDMFDKGATVRREKRWMVTGNILAGFAAVNNMGQIMTYTKNDGTTAQGVLMPRTFDFEKQQKNAPVKLNTLAKVQVFFDTYGPGAEVATQDGILKIQRQTNDKYRFLTSSSKREGGKYFLDRGLTDIIGDFYKSGQTMSATFYLSYKPEMLNNALKYMLDNGYSLVANNNKEEARKAFQVPLENVEVDPTQRVLNPQMSAMVDRQQLIAKLQSAKQRRAGVVSKYVKGEAGLRDQAQLTELTEIAKSLKDAIKSTKPERRDAKNFFRDATDRWEEGELSDAVYDVISEVYKKYPFVLTDLKLTVRQPKEGQKAAGQYNPNEFERLVYLYKGTSGVTDPVTIRHELMHSLEQMMSEEATVDLIEEWEKKIKAAAKTDKNPRAKKFFETVVNFFDNPSEFTYQEVLDALPSYEYYQYVNPSEYWAVNAEPLMARKLGSGWDKFVLAVKRLFEGLKNVFGFDNNYAVHKALKEVMSGEHKRIGSAALVSYVTNQKISLENQNTRRNYKGQPAPLATWDAPNESTTFTNWQYRLQDKHVDTKHVVEEIEKSIGNLKDVHDPYLMENNYHGRVAEQKRELLNKEFKPLFQEMIDMKVDVKDFEEYLHNRHAKTRNAIIAARNPAMPDGGSGFFNDEVDAYFDELNKNTELKKKYEQLAKHVDDIIRKTQDHLVKNGQETQETIDRWRQTMPDYVPLNRDPDELDFVSPGSGLGQGFGSRGSFSREATGSLKTVDSILGSIALAGERAIIRGEKARVGRALYALAISAPNPDFWLPINPDAIKNRKKLEAELINLGLSKDDRENIMQEPRSSAIDESTGMVSYRINPALRNSPNVFPIRINGKDRYIIFNAGNPIAKRMVQSLKNLDANQVSEGLGILAEATRLMASMNTQYNLVFGMWNFARDVGEGAVNLSNTPIAHRRTEVAMNSVPAVRAIYRSLREKGATTPEMKQWMDWFKRFEAAGGQTGYSEQFSRMNERAEIIEKEIDKLKRTGWRKGRDVTLQWMSDFNDAAENAVRLAAFRAAVEEGMSDDRAAYLAKNLTVNFNRKGSWTANINAFWAFFNARVQGAARSLQTLTEKGPDGKIRLSAVGKKIIKGGMILGVLQAFLLMAAGFDDDEPPEFIKDKNFIIPLFGTNGKYVALPYPPGFSAIPAVGRVLGEYAFSGFEKPGKRIGQITSIVFDAFNPLGSSDFAQTVAPTIFDPLVGVLATNRDAFGRPISREQRVTNPTPGYERSRESATLFSKGLAYGINYITGGGAEGIGKYSPTGDDIDYLIQQYAGGAAREVLKGGRAVASAFDDEPLPSYKVPLFGKAYGETGSPAAITDKFYKNVTMLAEHEGTLKRMQEAKKNTSEYRQENPETTLIKSANNLENRVSKLNHTKRELLKKEQTESVKAQIKRIEEQKTRIMKDFNDRVKKLEQQ